AASISVLDAVEQLVAQHTLLVFRIAYSVLRNHADAEDAAQECFLRVLKNSKRLGDVRSPKTWLARVAWTTALDKYRSRRAMLSLDSDTQEGVPLLDHLAGNAAAPDDQLAQRQMQAMLQVLIAGLPEDLRHTLELSTVQELNSAEIAEVLGIPEGSVRTRLMRARNLLKEKLSSRLEANRNA
ncbi:MAG TPA: sigma-70 family RNA polymerase sigma factor, partial [Alphaproteobacteria bacterium]|nr:sigma-70 family RNA polymerase sigma factor [Alphaproteobacteria bacterium]